MPHKGRSGLPACYVDMEEISVLLQATYEAECERDREARFDITAAADGHLWGRYIPDIAFVQRLLHLHARVLAMRL